MFIALYRTGDGVFDNFFEWSPRGRGSPPEFSFDNKAQEPDEFYRGKRGQVQRRTNYKGIAQQRHASQVPVSAQKL
jgi:hypothetical protein